MFTTRQRRSLEIRSWPVFTVPYKRDDGFQITMSEMRAWCKNHFVGKYLLEEIKREGVFVKKRIPIGIIARIEHPEDQVLFRLKWHDFK